MKTKIEIIGSTEEEMICFRVYALTAEVKQKVRQIRELESTLYAKKNEATFKLSYSDIFYIESVDKKTFIYTQEEVYNVAERLYQLEEILPARTFLRVSKAMIVNLDKMMRITPSLSGRFEAVLQNQEKISISRSYVRKMKETLGI